MSATARPSTSPQLGDGTVERALTRATRHLLLTWALTALAAVGLALLGGVVVHAGAGRVHDPLQLVVLLAVPAAGVALVARLRPVPAPPLASTVTPSPNLRRRLESWVEEVSGNRVPVRVTDACVVRVDVDGALVVGMPYVAGLTPAELTVLVRAAVVRHEVDSRSSVRLALGLTHLPHLDRVLHRVLASVVASFEEAHSAYLRARWAEDEDYVFVEPRAELVAEAWRHVTEAWLAPGREVGVEHASPFSGLAAFLDACERDGALSTRAAGHAEDTTPMLARTPWSRSERRAAADLFGVEDTGRPLVDWEEHPRAVALRQWRSSVARGVTRASATSGRPVAASIGALAQAVPDALTDDWREVLVAAARLHLVESGVATLAWEWPLGTLLMATSDEPLALDVPAAVARASTPHQVVAWLQELGVDTGATVWLGDQAPRVTERSVYAVGARLDRRRVRLVLTDHALHVVPGSRSRRRASAQRLFPTSDPAMEAIDAGRPLRQVEVVRWSEVARARLSPVTLGTGWRLHLRTSDGRRLVLRGAHDFRAEEELLREFLGERLRVRWSHRRPVPRALRYAVRTLSSAVGGTALVVAALGVVHPTAGTTWHECVALGAAGLGVLALGLAPDALARLYDARRRRS